MAVPAESSVFEKADATVWALLLGGAVCCKDNQLQNWLILEEQKDRPRQKLGQDHQSYRENPNLARESERKAEACSSYSWRMRHQTRPLLSRIVIRELSFYKNERKMATETIPLV
ncbi:hypothetical protein JG688_00003460 [Phytophthora aleatoria]|uniref:Uncharacterized protein n=1 Tax=Phytophthora aleatoria TaxID=2496075 RepID=A0A8J5MC19_9STRA|nr:hypothetical protein JG688_00003460 [Phytophthora aleatoria]